MDSAVASRSRFEVASGTTAAVLALAAVPDMACFNAAPV